MSIISNKKGSLHIIAMVTLFVFLVGAWCLYHSWLDGHLQQDVKQIVSEYQDIGKQIIEKE